MVFGFFSRSKPGQAAVPKAEDLLETHSPALDTPSPTLSEADAPPQSPELQPLDSENLKKRTRSLSPDKIHRLGHSSNESQPLVAPLSLTLSPEELLSLIKLVPPQTLYEYVLAHLPTATESEATTLATFFKQLTPPPRFHCARCHKEYTEVENTDRSCHVAHDDESAIVEHVGSTKRHTYETLWGCCNRTVEVSRYLLSPLIFKLNHYRVTAIKVPLMAGVTKGNTPPIASEHVSVQIQLCRTTNSFHVGE